MSLEAQMRRRNVFLRTQKRIRLTRVNNVLHLHAFGTFWSGRDLGAPRWPSPFPGDDKCTMAFRMKPFVYGILVFCMAWPSSADAAIEKELSAFIATPATLALDVYQRWISPAKGSSCPMLPSDSAYARQALRRHGLILGVLMTADRLHRCGHDVDEYPVLATPQGLKYSDPLSERTHD